MDNDDEDEDEDACEETKWVVFPPTAAKKAEVCRNFDVFDRHKHPSMGEKGACLIFFENELCSRGTVATRGGSTSGLVRHVLTHH